ncbi:ankyrin repeat and protein kinase domain-containing protein 1 [Hypoxylon cercidicola]|nr:ankyrin repeat and protein kinase domain-containing protein 1 [Hypoxylon cercidicola]
MSDTEGSAPVPHHLDFIAAAVKGDEERLRKVFSEQSHWSSALDRAVLRQALQEAAGQGKLQIICLLLEWGAEIEPHQDDEVSPLFRAVEGRHPSIVLKLLEQGADPGWRHPKDGQTALFIACLHGLTSAVDILLKAGADPQATGDGGWTALHAAAQSGHASVVALLVQAGAALNSQLTNGMTSLHWAASNGDEDVVRLLLTNPAVNLDIKDRFHRTPMLCAVERNYMDIALLLSPHRAGERLSPDAKAACQAFEATVVDFGQFGKRQLVFKESVYDLLYGWDHEADKPTKPILPENVKYRPGFRWIHLPANNVAWIETLLAKSFAEGGFPYQDIESFKALEECFDQEQHGSLAHDHSMRPFCQRIVPPQPHSAGRSSSPAQSPDRGESSPHLPRSKAEHLDEHHPKQHRKPSTPSRKGRHEEVDESLEDAKPGNVVLFMPFLHYETVEGHEKMDKAIKNVRTVKHSSVHPSSDLQLLNGYLNHQRPLHIRRTLDQYFYSGIETAARDKDQVVSRYCKRNHWQERMLMVDQLWLWIIGKDLVITCFAKRWGQPKNDPLNVLDSIIEETVNTTQAPVTSAYHLATLIFNTCCNIFDRPRVDRAYQFLDMFESSTGLIINRQTQLLRSFNKVSALSARWLKDRQRHQGHSDGHDLVLDALLELGEESAMLNEINDVRDELSIIVMILDSQTAILGMFESVIIDEVREGGGAKRPAVDGLVGLLRKRCREQQRRIETRYRDLQRMDRRAENAYTSLRSLLELKQMQSNALEAKFARDQAVAASRQGQAILVFTVVTIVFVPMSFIATLFTINDVWGNPLTLPYVAKYTFGIGLSISIPLVVMALTVNDIINAMKWFLIEARSHLFHDSTPSGKGGLKFEMEVEEDFGTYASNGDDLLPEKRSRRPSPYPPGGHGYNRYTEEAADGMPTPLDKNSNPQGHIRTNDSVSWARRTMHRGRARGSDDPESGSIG